MGTRWRRAAAWGMSAALGATALALSGTGTARPAAAQALSFPLLQATRLSAATFGAVRPAGPGGSLAKVAVSLNGVRANSTYTVYACQSLSNTNLACFGDPNSDVVSTDAGGGVSATLTFPSPPPVVDHIKVINNDDPSDAYVADIPPNPFSTLNAAPAFTVNEPVISQPAPPPGPPGPVINPLLAPYGTQGIPILN